MRRFTFSLERVLKHKERREQLAEMQQLRALGVLRAREAVAAALRQRLNDVGIALAARERQTLDLTAWLANYRHVERLTRDLTAADAQVREAARLLHEAAAQRRQKAREAEALRQLRTRQHAEHAAQAAKTEQQFLDEQGLRRWLDPETGAAWAEETMS